MKILKNTPLFLIFIGLSSNNLQAATYLPGEEALALLAEIAGKAEPIKQAEEKKSYKKECLVCGKLHHNLAAHMRMHTGERPFICTHQGCTRTFKQLTHLLTHELDHTGERPHKCHHQGCTLSFKRSSTLREHKRIHTGEKPYKCEYPNCEARFRQMSTRNQHMRSHTKHPIECSTNLAITQ